MKQTIPIALAVLLGACAAPQAPLPDENYYRLAPGTTAPRAAALTNGLLMVEEPRSDGLLAERALLFSDDPGHRRTNQYHYDYWSDPATRVVQSYLVKQLRGSGVADQVMRYDINVTGDAFIGSRLERFSQLIDGDHTRVVVALELRLSYPGEQQPRLLRDYSAEVNVASSTPEDAIPGYEQALDTIIRQFLNDAANAAGSPR